MKRVYTLYRVSTKQQVNFSEDHQNDIPMQRGACREFIDTMPDWQLVKEYEEKGVSGYKVSARDRDAILDIQEAAKRHEFDVLLVFMFDRLGRIDDETPFLVEWFVKEMGIEVWSVKEGQQRFDSHVDKLTNYIRFWQASGESEKTSMRIKTRMQQLSLQGLYMGGAVPYGYRLTPSGERNRKGVELMRYEIDEEQYAVYRLVVEKTINYGMGSYILAGYLNDHGYKPSNGREFHSNTILRMLRSPLARGLSDEGESSVELERLRIISDDEARQIDEILAQRADYREERRKIAMRTKGESMLSGNIYCGHCGSRISTTHHLDHYERKDGSIYHHDSVRYRCHKKANKRCICDGQTSYDCAKVDAAVCQVMRQIFNGLKGIPDEERFQKLMRRKLKSHQAARRQEVRKLENNKKQMEILQAEIPNTLLGDSIYSSEELKGAMNVIRARIAEGTEHVAELDEEIAHDTEMSQTLLDDFHRFKSWGEEFDAATMEQKKMIACQIFDRIELSKGYKITLYMNVLYEQFCSDGHKEIVISCDDD